MPTSGLYYLYLHVPATLEIGVGRLGVVSFPAGYYIYTGSAMGGLEGRIQRHLNSLHFGQKRPHWHVDYLLPRCEMVGVVLYPTGWKGECALNQALSDRFAATIPAPGFGSSDCRCKSHLLYIGREPIDTKSGGIKDAGRQKGRRRCSSRPNLPGSGLDAVVPAQSACVHERDIPEGDVPDGGSTERTE